MLILQDKNGKEFKAYKSKNMSTESYDYSIHRTKSGSIDGRPYRFHHYNYGCTFYFYYKESQRWYKITYYDEKALHFNIVGKVRE